MLPLLFPANFLMSAVNGGDPYVPDRRNSDGSPWSHESLSFHMDTPSWAQVWIWPWTRDSKALARLGKGLGVLVPNAFKNDHIGA